MNRLQRPQRLLLRLPLIPPQKTRRDRIRKPQHVHRSVAIARSAPFSFTTIPMISTPGTGPSSRSTSSESAICGTAAGDTKLTASICRNPASTSRRRYAAFRSAGIVPLQPLPRIPRTLHNLHRISPCSLIPAKASPSESPAQSPSAESRSSLRQSCTASHRDKTSPPDSP